MTIDIKFTDYFRLTKPSDKQIDEWKDSLGMPNIGKRALRVRMEATHAGLVNRNNKFYIPSRMAEGVSTFRIGEKPTKIMKNHKKDSDPVGVIRGARFVPTVPEGLRMNQDVMNLMSSSAPIKAQLKSIKNLWRAGVFNRDGWRGLGYIELIGDILDPESIEQISDGRFDAVSTDFRSPNAVHCLHCAKNWASDGECEHEPFNVYPDAEDDGFAYPALPIPAVHKYLEASLVAFEGDALATVEIADSLDTSKNKTIFLSADWKESFDSTEPAFEFRDFEEGTMAIENKPVLSEAEQKVFDVIKKSRENMADDMLVDFAKKITALQDKDGNLPYQAEAEVDFDTAILYALDNLETADKKVDDEVIAQIDALYQEEFAKMFEDKLLTDEEFADAKLSTEKRKSLPETSFCGPDRAFPCPDCAHVTAAKRLIGRYKGPGDKTRILACVNRKSKAMGCEDSEEKEGSEDSAVNAVAPKVCMEDSLKTMQDNELRSLYMAVELELVARKQKMAYECKECALHEEKMKKAVEDMNKAHADSQEKDNVLRILRNELARTQAEYVAMVDSNVEIRAELLNAKTEKLAQIGVLSGKYDNLDNAKDAIKLDVPKAETMFSDFDIMTVAGKLNDGMSRDPKGTVEDPTVNTDVDNKQIPGDLKGPAAEAAVNIREMVKSGNIRDAKHIYATMKSLKLFPDTLTFESFSAAEKNTAE